MRLYFFRHGPALSRSEWSGPDAERPLTEQGAALVKAVSTRMASIDPPIDVVLASPYARAWDTGRILVEVLGSPELLVSERALEPGRLTHSSLQEALVAHAGANAVVLIGHEPSMTAAISSVIGGGALALKKAGLARVDLWSADPLAGELRWLFPPKML